MAGAGNGARSADFVARGGVGGERVTRAYTVEVQTASVFYAQSSILFYLEPYGSQVWTHYIGHWSGTLYR